MRLEYFVACEIVVTDSETNSTSIINVLEELPIPQYPALLPKCAVIALWRAEPGDEHQDWQAAVGVTPPGGQRQSFSMNFRVAPGVRRHRHVVRMLTLTIERAGELRFDVELNGVHHAEHIITVLNAPNAVTPTVVAVPAPPQAAPTQAH